MRLAKLQISGFKSFVDPTDIRLPADLVAVVGPNGCGKSNIIDAVRWVLGESSARLLRGDQMADVIFNGSSARAPVGRASVELIFDNSDATATGGYAGFAEISVRRTLSRDGNSAYFINRAKARRKDVLDLFRGTGLGPRSYAIIEQGMVGRIIEARPEELRAFVEEAAGTSKYKDRRRETELRITRTRENLERVSDIRDEMEKTLRRLKRQAGAARRYTALKDEQRIISGQLQVLKLRELESRLAQQERASAAFADDLESAQTAMRAGEAESESLRRQHSQAVENDSRARQMQYQREADIKNTEQRIAHLAETRERQTQDAERLQSEQRAYKEELNAAQTRLQELQTSQTEHAPKAAELDAQQTQAAASLARAEAALEAWRERWEAFGGETQDATRLREVQQSRIAQLQQHLQRATSQSARLQQELDAAREAIAAIDIDAMRDEVKRNEEAWQLGELEFQQAETAMQQLEQRAREKREANAKLHALQLEAQSRLASLRQIQEAALDSAGDDAQVQNWLRQNALAERPKLATRIRVSDGWQRAADRVLHDYLGALCVKELPRAFDAMPDCELMLLAEGKGVAEAGADARPRLSDKVVAGDVDLSGFLGDVYLAESLGDARAMQSSLGARECIVTRDGELLGRNWLSFASQSRLATGVLVREEEMKRLQEKLDALEGEAEAGDAEIRDLESQREAQLSDAQKRRAAREKLRGELTDLHAQLAREETRRRETMQRIATMENELDGLGGHVQSDHDAIAEARELMADASTRQEVLGEKRAELLREKDALAARVDDCKTAVREAGERVHHQALQNQQLHSELQSTNHSIARLQSQLQRASEDRAQLHSALAESQQPQTELQNQLQDLQQQLAAAAENTRAAAATMAELDTRIAEFGERQARLNDAVTAAREALERHNLARQGTAVRRDTQSETMAAHGYDRAKLEAEMPAEAEAEEWARREAALQEKIDRIGAVNLVAIEEFDEQNARKTELDEQHADLSEALDTLQSVIRKIDRETRGRLKETFARLNAGFNEFFPKLFGGGEAELQLTGDDFLTAGVVVVARPPGKRNTHIHLLSGGEKALTAVALLFALFKLNPAPFCMLDEVDAPLDDANVARYCDTLKTLVRASQMIVITHNKITMEAADVLVGVTMGEPGVSRLVSVDVEQAVELAAQ